MKYLWELCLRVTGGDWTSLWAGGAGGSQQVSLYCGHDNNAAVLQCDQDTAADPAHVISQIICPHIILKLSLQAMTCWFNILTNILKGQIRLEFVELWFIDIEYAQVDTQWWITYYNNTWNNPQSIVQELLRSETFIIKSFKFKQPTYTWDTATQTALQNTAHQWEL